MEEYRRLLVNTQDRIGMTLDVLQVVYRYNLNIAAMEVSPGKIFLKIQSCPAEVLKQLKKDISALGGVKEQLFIELMPYEERERQLKAVMDSVDEGIVAVDARGRINIFNPSAEKILNYRAEEVLGKPVSEVLADDIPMLNSLKTGQGYDNEEIMLKTARV